VVSLIRTMSRFLQFFFSDGFPYETDIIYKSSVKNKINLLNVFFLVLVVKRFLEFLISFSPKKCEFHSLV